MAAKQESMKRVQSLIKGWLDELEKIEGWKQLPPIVVNDVRHAVMRIAWGAYKVGLLSDRDEKVIKTNA